LTELQKKSDLITDVRGLGLMMGIELKFNISDIISECRKKGLLLVGAGSTVIRFVPPLIVTEKEIDKALSILESVINKKKGLIQNKTVPFFSE
ncbi:MAG: aminotransferase class III-fold pyridoxal phosphate-dependent enzyme, partial [Spirochaetota bacterium]|nr:aminotransferase class III-fold pyridoxal phosphate-dependent enzyme [Spirochaetota bacterium]